MILNIHGFSSPEHNFSEHPGRTNGRYDWLVKNFKDHNIVSPDIFYYKEKPKEILNRLLGYISIAQYNNEDVHIIAASLGGFYGYILNTIYPAYKTILINPSLAPFMNLRRRYNVTSDICKEYIRMLGEYVYDVEDRTNLHVFLGRDDLFIDHQEITIPLLPVGFQQYEIIKNATHEISMSRIEEKVKNIL